MLIQQLLINHKEIYLLCIGSNEKPNISICNVHSVNLSEFVAFSSSQTDTYRAATVIGTFYNDATFHKWQ
jgi:hypothetical protein